MDLINFILVIWWCKNWHMQAKMQLMWTCYVNPNPLNKWQQISDAHMFNILPWKIFQSSSIHWWWCSKNVQDQAPAEAIKGGLVWGHHIYIFGHLYIQWVLFFYLIINGINVNLYPPLIINIINFHIHNTFVNSIRNVKHL